MTKATTIAIAMKTGPAANARSKTATTPVISTANPAIT